MHIYGESVAADKARQLFLQLLENHAPFEMLQLDFESLGPLALPDDLYDMLWEVWSAVKNETGHALYPNELSIEFFSAANRLHLLRIV